MSFIRFFTPIKRMVFIQMKRLWSVRSGQRRMKRRSHYEDNGRDDLELGSAFQRSTSRLVCVKDSQSCGSLVPQCLQCRIFLSCSLPPLPDSSPVVDLIYYREPYHTVSIANLRYSPSGTCSALV